MSDQETPETQNPAEPAVNLTVNDLILMLNTIQVVTQRGAIKAEEMTVVGGLYERLYKFLDSQGALSKPTSESAAENNDASVEK